MRFRPFFVMGWREGFVAAALFACVAPLYAADALFPQPLHLVRRIEDPLAARAIVIHEYCAGNEVVTVNGSRVAIADYGKQTLTEIDRAAGTYSITRFEDLAQAAPRIAHQKTAELPKIAVNVEASVRLSRAALDVLIGAAYPNQRTSEHDAIVKAARGGDSRLMANAAAAEDFALPVLQSVTYDAGGDAVTVRNAIVEVRGDLAPAEVKIIPPGARLVESHAVRAARELRALDQLPTDRAQH